MTSLFPTQMTIDMVRESIRGAPEFFEKEVEGMLFFNYKYCNPRTFPDPESGQDDHQKLLLHIRRECRGLAFNLSTGKVIARRYHKFFNVDEMEETHQSKIDLKQNYIVLTKWDGTLLSPVITPNGDIRFATKSGFGDVSNKINERFLSLDSKKNYFDFSKFWLEKDYTPIFEWCSPRNVIVLRYEEDQLILTAIRNNNDGNYVKYDEMIQSCQLYDIPCTNIEVGTIDNLDDFQIKLREKIDIEGIVIRFDDGRMYKLKTDWYFSKRKKEKQEYSLNSERNIWRLILEQTIDDAITLLSNNDQLFKLKVQEFQIILYDAIERTATELHQLVQKYQNLSKKLYVDAIRGDNTIETWMHHILFPIYNVDRDTVVDQLIAYVIKNCSTPSSLENARTLLGGIKFVERLNENNENEGED